MPEDPKQEDIDELMKVLAASAMPPAAARAETAASPAASPMTYEPLVPAASQPRSDAGLDFLGDVNVQVRIELGSAAMNVQEVLKLGSGSIVGLSSQIGDPVNVFVNDRLVARGEVLVVRDKLAVRITEIVPVPKA
ncbi:MAG TPA: flagellar motor switch protein FliN [Planctomycetota bacterium]|nr:flagellar motor switch protein FliN [Planctomycetota bacterium]